MLILIVNAMVYMYIDCPVEQCSCIIYVYTLQHIYCGIAL